MPEPGSPKYRHSAEHTDEQIEHLAQMLDQRAKQKGLVDDAPQEGLRVELHGDDTSVELDDRGATIVHETEPGKVAYIATDRTKQSPGLETATSDGAKLNVTEARQVAAEAFRKVKSDIDEAAAEKHDKAA